MKIKNTSRQLQEKLINHPFFPLLFIGKATETTAYYLFVNAQLEEVLVTYVLAIITTLMWLAADGDFDFLE